MFADVRNSSAVYTTAVRALNAPIGVWFSCFTHTSVPRRSHSRGHRNCGVGGMTAYTSAWASLISSMVGKAVAANTSLAMRGSAPVNCFGAVASLAYRIQFDFIPTGGFEWLSRVDMPKRREAWSGEFHSRVLCSRVSRMCTSEMGAEHADAVHRNAAAWLSIGYSTSARGNAPSDLSHHS